LPPTTAKADRRAALVPPKRCAWAVSVFAGRKIIMVDDDTLVELWRRFLMDPRTSVAEIRRMSLLAQYHYEDFRLQLIAWSLKNEP
jgi:hypothetical protein